MMRIEWRREIFSIEKYEDQIFQATKDWQKYSITSTSLKSAELIFVAGILTVAKRRKLG